MITSRCLPYVLPLAQISVMSSVYCTTLMSFERYARICYICQLRSFHTYYTYNLEMGDSGFDSRSAQMEKSFSSRAYERTCGMARGKKRGTHSISNLLFSLFKISPPLPLRTVVEAGGIWRGRSSRGGGGEAWSDAKSKSTRMLISF